MTKNKEEPRTDVMNFRIRPSLKQKFIALCKRRNVTAADELNEMIESYCEDLP